MIKTRLNKQLNIFTHNHLVVVHLLRVWGSGMLRYHVADGEQSQTQRWRSNL